MSTKKSRDLSYYLPPIVTILGHVDHGKTTLLDIIRKTDIASGESGGITQHIGAYQVTVHPKGEPASRAIRQPEESREIPSEIDTESQGRRITFIDTPGHEAFAKMRGRGAKVADIAVLVVAANDGIMPQTTESISHIQAAKIPCIVAINKIDLPGVNLEKIKKQLVKSGLNLEEYGGEIPVIPVSAKLGTGIEKLLETILFLAELYSSKNIDLVKLNAVVIESSLSKNKGITATIIIRSGNLTVGDEVVSDNQQFRIRALYNWKGVSVRNAKTGDPVEILGWKQLPPVGSQLFQKNQIALDLKGQKSIAPQIKTSIILNLPERDITEEKIKVIIKSDTFGTLEAIRANLKDKVYIIYSGVGDITESDILLAKTTSSLVVGFHLTPKDHIIKLANSEKVIIKTYNIIYELFTEIDEVIEAIKKGNLVEVFGEAEVIALFPYNDEMALGIKIKSGRIARGDQVKIIRNGEEIGRARIKSLRRGKEDITRMEKGSEAGVLLSAKLDILTGDSIIPIG